MYLTVLEVSFADHRHRGSTLAEHPPQRGLFLFEVVAVVVVQNLLWKPFVPEFAALFVEKGMSILGDHPVVGVAAVGVAPVFTALSSSAHGEAARIGAVGFCTSFYTTENRLS